MRAIYYLSILNNDFICILDRNMKVFLHDVMAVQGLGGQVRMLRYRSHPQRMIKKINMLLAASYIWRAVGWPLFARAPAIIGVNWNFDTD